MTSPGANRLSGFWSRRSGQARRVYNVLGNSALLRAGDYASMITPRETSTQHPRRRAELIARVRREIQLGIYETPEKWAIALGRLCDALERIGTEDEQDERYPSR